MALVPALLAVRPGRTARTQCSFAAGTLPPLPLRRCARAPELNTTISSGHPPFYTNAASRASAGRRFMPEFGRTEVNALECTRSSPRSGDCAMPRCSYSRRRDGTLKSRRRSPIARTAWVRVTTKLESSDPRRWLSRSASRRGREPCAPAYVLSLGSYSRTASRSDPGRDLPLKDTR